MIQVYWIFPKKEANILKKTLLFMWSAEIGKLIYDNFGTNNDMDITNIYHIVSVLNVKEKIQWIE